MTTWRSGVYHLLQCAMYTPNSEQSTCYQSVCHLIFVFLCSFVLVLCYVVPNLPQMDEWNVNKFDSVIT